MARSDLLIDLVDAERRGDKQRFRALVEAIIAEERANQHHLVADRLAELITTMGSSDLLGRDDSATRVNDLVLMRSSNRSLSISADVSCLHCPMATSQRSHGRGLSSGGSKRTLRRGPGASRLPAPGDRSYSGGGWSEPV